VGESPFWAPKTIPGEIWLRLSDRLHPIRKSY
jgi:hypothetical protein